MPMPVLMYHEVNKETVMADLGRYLQKRYFVREQCFREQMSFLVKSGFKTVYPENLYAKEAAVESPSVLLTFDDGYAGNYECVLPVLKKYGLKAIFFITAGWVGKKHMLTWEQIREISEAGMEIGSHTYSHAMVGELGLNEVREELKKSKEIIEQNIGKKVIYVSYPNGSCNAGVHSTARSLGYKYLFTSSFGYWDISAPGGIVPRITVSEDVRAFNKILEKEYFYVLKQRLIETIKTMPPKILGKKIYNKLYCKIFDLKEIDKQ